MSWSLGSSLLDILLAAWLLPDQPACTSPGTQCQDPPRGPSRRADYSNVLLRCEHHHLAELNHTLCADVLASWGAGFAPSLLRLCRALNSLNTNQVEQVWSNACLVLQALGSLLLGGAPCAPEPGLAAPALQRVAREAPNLQQLACDYNSWLAKGVEGVLVALCSDNEREVFVERVCGDAPLLRALLSHQSNSWLYAYCANWSADAGRLVDQLCEYERWVVQPTEAVGPALLEFCLEQDGPSLSRLICQNTALFVILFSNPENGRLMPNCSGLSPSGPGQGSLALDACRYSEWRDLALVSSDLLSQCIRLDHQGFKREVCANTTFLNSLLLQQANAWLGDHCSASLSLRPPAPTRPFAIADWCNYSTWGGREVDDSVVGLCWQNDRAAFERNVCCNVALFEKLLRDPQNEWLKSVCSSVNEEALLAQVSSSLDTQTQGQQGDADLGALLLRCAGTRSGAAPSSWT